MKTDILTPKALFRKDIRYTIPVFQRPYVWTQDEQWEPLWEDVRNTAENYLDELDRSDDNVEAEQRTSPHFLGAIVIQQVHTAAKDIEQREIIDGQQRVTTLQLLLDAIQQVCEEFELKPEAKRLSKLVTNDKDLIGTDENQIFKLWPTAHDREAFRHAMHNGLATDHFEDSRIVQAHEFFQLQTKQWLNADPAFIQRRIEALETTVNGMLYMVVIDLKPQDDPHVIFETLNARGTPLLESDLIKNYAISKANQASKNESDIWDGLEHAWWREEVEQGRLHRPRIDMLLNYWLAMRTTSEVPASRVFNAFRSLADDAQIDDVMSDVKRDLENYRLFETGTRTSDEDMFHYRVIQVMHGRVITPVLLLLLSVPCEKRAKSLYALESFLIRRMVCRGTTKDYNRLILDLADELQKNGLHNSYSTVVNFLKSQTADSREWPDDEALGRSLDTLPVYRLLTRGRLRLILEGIEGKLRQSSMAEHPDFPKNLTIEHVMPQSWEANWPLPEDIGRLEGTNKRNHLVHTIGNLTLVSRRLNPSLSNAPWEDKRKTLGEHSVLFLNKTLLDESQNSAWDEQFIQFRSKRMAALVADVWPGPNSLVWEE